MNTMKQVKVSRPRQAHERWAEVLEASQAIERINVCGETYYRIAADWLCDLCGCDTGMLHAFLCEREECPRCPDLLLTCSCRMERGGA